MIVCNYGIAALKTAGKDSLKAEEKFKSIVNNTI
jgi:hypothetical protein